MNLKEENKILREKLERASKWMQREVKNSEKIITQDKAAGDKNIFLKDSREDIISREIYRFFPPNILIHFPEHAIENIISSEIIFYQIIQGNHVDGSGVILGYQKVLDAMVEQYITKGFRKYIQKNKLTRSPENIPLEKSLYSVIEKKYILSLGRLYHILENISQKKQAGHYEMQFRNFLSEKVYLKKALLESDFLLQLEGLIHMHALGEKRHSGNLGKQDTVQARKNLCGDFREKNCMLYLLAASQSVDV